MRVSYSQDSLALGGGGACGLYLDCELFGGTTGTCKTFNSPPLTGAESEAASTGDNDDDDGDDSVDFQCSNLEVWGFTPSTSNPMARHAGDPPV